MEHISIKRRMKEIYDSEYMPFYIFSIAIFLMIFRVSIQPGNDDSWFQLAIAQNGVFKWVYDRYFNWSGRVSIEIVLGFINYNMIIWKILNSIMGGLLMLCISRFIVPDIESKNTRRNINIFLCCSFFFLYPYTVTSSMVWCTGSFYYLWAGTAMLCALLPFYQSILERKTVYKITNWLYFIASWYASYMEQEMAILLCFGAITLLVLKLQKRKIPRILMTQYIFIIFNSTISILAPGTSLRSLQEQHWYPNFQNTSRFERIFEAINWTNKHLLISSNVIFLIFTFLILMICWKKYRKTSRSVIMFSAIPFIFVLLRIIPFNAITSRVFNYQNGLTENLYQADGTKEITLNIEGVLDRLFYDPMLAFNNGYVRFTELLPSIACFTITLFVGVLLLVCFKDKRLKFITFILYYASLASGYIIGLSPTIYASGNRIFFVGDILILIILGLLLREFIQDNEVIYNNNANLVRVIMIAGAGVMLITYIGLYCNQIVCL